MENDNKWITEKCENKVEIEDWEELFVLYINKPEFSKNKIFDMAFRLFLLWNNLTKTSKSHQSRYHEVKSQAVNYFEGSN